MRAQGYLGNLGEPMASLSPIAGVRATGLPKGPGAHRAFPHSERARRGDTNQRDNSRVPEASDERSDRNEPWAVVAEHSTDDHGEPRPKGPTGGKAKLDMMVHWEERRKRP